VRGQASGNVTTTDIVHGDGFESWVDTFRGMLGRFLAPGFGVVVHDVGNVAVASTLIVNDPDDSCDDKLVQRSPSSKAPIRRFPARRGSTRRGSPTTTPSCPSSRAAFTRRGHPGHRVFPLESVETRFQMTQEPPVIRTTYPENP
jgi:hypothetical protein